MHDGQVKYVDWPTQSLRDDGAKASPGSGTSVTVKLQGLKVNAQYTAKVDASHGGMWSDYSAFSADVILITQTTEVNEQPRKRALESEGAVCMNYCSKVAMDPCGHLCACQQCTDSLEVYGNAL